MVKTKRRLYDDTKVRLKIVGPSSIIGPQPIRVPQNRRIYLCNNNTKVKCGSKWPAKLTDKVRHYVNRYRKDREYYTVRIRYPETRKGHQNEDGGRKLKPTTSRNMPLAPVAFGMPPPAVPSTSRGTRASGDGKVSNFQDIPTHSRSDSQGATDDMDQDSASLVTTLSQQLEELRLQEIPYENLKPLATNRSSKYDNDALLRMKKEITIQMQHERWRKTTKRAPLCCSYLLDNVGFVNNN